MKYYPTLPNPLISSLEKKGATQENKFDKEPEREGQKDRWTGKYMIHELGTWVHAKETSGTYRP